MADIITVQIDEVEEAKTKSGSPMLRVQADGELYSAFRREDNPNLFNDIRSLEGQVARVGFEAKGKYKNIVEIEPTGEVAEVQGGAVEMLQEGKPSQAYWHAKDRRIARLSCVSSAAIVCAAYINQGKEIKVSGILMMAKGFEKYVYGEDTPAQPSGAE